MSPLLPAKTSLLRAEENQIKDILVKAYAMNEVHTRVWQDADDLKALGINVEDNVKILGNADGQGVLRTTLMQCMLPFVNKNKNVRPSFGLFEIGRCVEGVREDDTANEVRHLAVALYSKEDTEKVLYFKAVEMINTIVSQLKHKGVSYEKTEIRHMWQHPKNTSIIKVDDKEIGIINTLHPKNLVKIAKNASVVLVEIDMDKLLSVESAKLSFDEPSKFPGIDYDLSLLIPDGIRFENIESCWAKEIKKELKKVSVIDIYDNGVIKSVTLRFHYENSERTLTSEEVQKSIDKILENLKNLNVEMKL